MMEAARKETHKEISKTNKGKIASYFKNRNFEKAINYYRKITGILPLITVKYACEKIADDAGVKRTRIISGSAHFDY